MYSSEGPGFYEERLVGFQHRPEGRILLSPNSSCHKKVSQDGILRHSLSIQGSSLLDDWLGDAQNREKAQLGSQLFVKIFAYLAFLINHQNSELTPTQVFHFVGINFNICLHHREESCQYHGLSQKCQSS